MPPKKDDNTAGSDANAVTGFSSKDTKLIAAAFIASVGPDKYDYGLMATLTGNTAGSLKKMWPVVKRKVIDAHTSFGDFLGASGNSAESKATVPKANAGRKRKAESDYTGNDAAAMAEINGADNKKKAPAKGKGAGRGRKKAKTESDSEAKKEESEDGDEHALGKDIEDEV